MHVLDMCAACRRCFEMQVDKVNIEVYNVNIFVKSTNLTESFQLVLIPIFANRFKQSILSPFASPPVHFLLLPVRFTIYKIKPVRKQIQANKRHMKNVPFFGIFLTERNQKTVLTFCQKYVILCIASMQAYG